MTIDIERLRDYLIDYFGSLAQIYPSAYMEVSRVENASYEELINIAISNNIDLSKFESYKSL